MGLVLPFPGQDYHEKLKEENLRLQRKFDLLCEPVNGVEYKELVQRFNEEFNDINLGKYVIFLHKHPKIEHNPDWSRLNHGKIYKEGYCGEMMFRAGDWKDYRFGNNREKLTPDDNHRNEMNRHYGGIVKYYFVKAQKLPHEEEDLHMRYYRRFNKLTRGSNDMLARGSQGGGKRKGKNPMAPESVDLSPRVEAAMGNMFEDMARTRDFSVYKQEEQV